MHIDSSEAHGFSFRYFIFFGFIGSCCKQPESGRPVGVTLHSRDQHLLAVEQRGEQQLHWIPVRIGVSGRVLISIFSFQ